MVKSLGAIAPVESFSMWMHELAQSGEYGVIVGWLFWIIASITLHELAHGWAAAMARRPHPTGPWAHDRISHGAHGPHVVDCSGSGGYRVGRHLPVNPQNFRMGRFGDALVALAGPAMNFLLALVTALLTPVAFHFSEELGRLLQLGVGLNILLGLFNLLPVPPFDGGRILVALVREVRQLFHSPAARTFP